MRSISFKQIAADYSSAIKWIEQLTERKVRGRLAEIGAIANDVGEKESDENGFLLNVGDKGISNYLLIVPDLVWLIEIARSLKSVKDANIYRSRLIEIQKGPTFPSEEQTGHQHHPKNLQFELLTGALLAAAGFDPIIEEIDCDGIHSLEGAPLLVECKRVASITGVREAIRKAKKQLSEACGKRNDRPSAVIALEGTKIHNNGELILEASSEDSSRRKVLELADEIAMEIRKESAFPEFILGVLIHTITVIKIGPKAATLSFWTFLPTSGLDPVMEKRLKSLSAGCEAWLRQA